MKNTSSTASEFDFVLFWTWSCKSWTWPSTECMKTSSFLANEKKKKKQTNFRFAHILEWLIKSGIPLNWKTVICKFLDYFGWKIVIYHLLLFHNVPNNFQLLENFTTVSDCIVRIWQQTHFGSCTYKVYKNQTTKPCKDYIFIKMFHKTQKCLS